mgnify:FL=1
MRYNDHDDHSDTQGVQAMDKGAAADRLNVDVLLRGGTVVSMDAERHVWMPGSVALCGREIARVGSVDELDRDCQAARVIDCSDHVIMPGLINTHTHMPMSLLRGLADDLRLDVWLYGYILPVEREFVTPEFCFLGTSLSCAEMLCGGTTTFADMYYHEEEIAWATIEAGMRGILGETIAKFPTPDARSYEASLRYCQEMMERFSGHPLITAVPAPHSLYMTTEEMLQETAALARAYGAMQLIHISETAGEVEAWTAQTGMRPVRWLESKGLLEQPVLAAHCVHVNAEEIGIMVRHGVGVAHNPSSNLKLASGIAPVAEMLAQGLAVGVGTDGCASNNDLDMFEETRLAALLPKGISGSPTVVPAAEAVAMATILGARALGLEHRIGSLEAGKLADVIVVSQRRAHAVPQFSTTGLNVYSQLAYTAAATDVRDVFVDGRQVVSDGRVLTIDVPQVLGRARSLAERINRFFVERQESVLDKLVDIGGVEQQETFEVQAKAVLTDRGAFDAALKHERVHVTSQTRREQYDTYFHFADASQGRLRYREDLVIRSDGSKEPIYTLTLSGPAREAEYEHSVVLSRSRFTAPAHQSLRFYREYFGPIRETEVSKVRERFHIRYRGVDFAVNADYVTAPALDQRYIEIKSRTWSEQDAERKASMIGELLHIFGATDEDMVLGEYPDLMS